MVGRRHVGGSRQVDDGTPRASLARVEGRNKSVRIKVDPVSLFAAIQ